MQNPIYVQFVAIIIVRNKIVFFKCVSIFIIYFNIRYIYDGRIMEKNLMIYIYPPLFIALFPLSSSNEQINKYWMDDNNNKNNNNT